MSAAPETNLPYRFTDSQMAKYGGSLAGLFFALGYFSFLVWNSNGPSLVILIIGLGLLHTGVYFALLEMRAPAVTSPAPQPSAAGQDPAVVGAEAAIAAASAARALPDVVDRIAASIEKRRNSTAFVSLGVAFMLLAAVMSGAVDVSIAFGSEPDATETSSEPTEEGTDEADATEAGGNEGG